MSTFPSAQFFFAYLGACKSSKLRPKDKRIDQYNIYVYLEKRIRILVLMRCKNIIISTFSFGNNFKLNKKNIF